MEEARLGRPADLAPIAELAAVVRAEQADARGGEIFQVREAGPWPLDDRVKAAMESDDGVVVVGLFDDVVFGYGLAVVETLADGRLLAILEDLVVHPEAREVGIGEAMMNLIVDEVQEKGCIGIDSRALPGDRGTKNFFESFGLKARLLTVHRRFEAP